MPEGPINHDDPAQRVKVVEDQEQLLDFAQAENIKAELQPQIEFHLARIREIRVVKTTETILSALSPERMQYHNIQHTQDVVKEAIFLALYTNRLVNMGKLDASEGFSDREIELLGISAFAHDMGLVSGRDHHEKKGAQTITNLLKQNGARYTEAEIELIGQSIICTEVQFDASRDCLLQIADPKTKFDRLLMDADVANFGRSDRAEVTALYARELQISPEDIIKFQSSTLKMMRNHSWRSTAGRQLRESKKRQNIVELEKELADV